MPANPSVYPVVIAQYERDDSGLGKEENLHWALLVVTDLARLSGPTFQAVDRLYSDGRGKVWELSYLESTSLRRTSKCLGGIQIGWVKTSQVNDLITLIQRHPVTPKSSSWNCRDWVVEVIGLLKTRGWIDPTVVPAGANVPGVLFPRFKVVSKQSVENNRKVNKPDSFQPAIMWIS
ncbi:hypothetical protein AcV7_000232 [Taiwanofungus camphoratus]|nr:hypothetical protein AcV7_000232 [Antrodia cinnamomea]